MDKEGCGTTNIVQEFADDLVDLINEYSKRKMCRDCIGNVLLNLSLDAVGPDKVLDMVQIYKMEGNIIKILH